jgi:hypothetical protein
MHSAAESWIPSSEIPAIEALVGIANDREGNDVCLDKAMFVCAPDFARFMHPVSPSHTLLSETRREHGPVDVCPDVESGLECSTLSSRPLSDKQPYFLIQRESSPAGPEEIHEPRTGPTSKHGPCQSRNKSIWRIAERPAYEAGWSERTDKLPGATFDVEAGPRWIYGKVAPQTVTLTAYCSWSAWASTFDFIPSAVIFDQPPSCDASYCRRYTEGRDWEV